MTVRPQKLRNFLIIALAILSGIFAVQYAFSQSSNARINLNTPVSFPVDI
jgi:hypothetical protein